MNGRLGGVAHAIFCVVLLAAGAVGCRGSAVPMGTVSGTVTLKGKPLTEGIVVFHNVEMGSGATAELDASGRYTMKAALRVGQYRVAIQPPLGAGPMAPIPQSDIPPAYQDFETSGLTAVVNTGHNVIDFEL